jgi:hypothetical protein
MYSTSRSITAASLWSLSIVGTRPYTLHDVMIDEFPFEPFEVLLHRANGEPLKTEVDDAEAALLRRPSRSMRSTELPTIITTRSSTTLEAALNC